MEPGQRIWRRPRRDRRGAEAIDAALDRAIWASLTGRQSHLAERHGKALRMHPDYGCFAATDDLSTDDLCAFLPYTGELFLIEPDPVAPPAGASARHRAITQMVADKLSPPGPAFAFAFEVLSEDDAPAMQALAALTQPGPFFRHTNRLGRFIGVKEAGVLIAMAGERLRPPGFTEVSGVCTHPAHRGKGYAGALLRHVAHAIARRGDTPFLTGYSDNEGALALYETLGFRVRRKVFLTALSRAG